MKLFIKAILTSALSFLLINVKAQEKTIIVEDNFSNNVYGWWIGRTANGSCEMGRGEYILRYNGEKSWSSNINVDLKQDEDFVIETKISRISGTNSNGYGLTWGKGKDGYYNFIITPNGKFYVRKVETGKKGSYLINWKKTQYISTSSITNKLRIQKQNNELEFFINDKYVAKIPFEQFFGNQIGFMMYQTQQIAVDYLVVYGKSRSAVVVNNQQDIIQPDLKILQIAVNDKQDIENMSSSFGNGNSIIEPGESIEITAFVQNFGHATAKDVEAKIVLSSDDRNISFPDEYKTFSLGDIKSGDYKKLNFFFFTSRRYESKELPFKVVLSEKQGSYKTEQSLGLKMNERTNNIVDADISKLEISEDADMKQITEIMELSDVDKNIPKNALIRENTLAVIIGVENYKYAPNVEFAQRDAQVMYKYVSSVFGIPKENTYFLTNKEATYGEFNKIFSKDGWLARRTAKGESNIIVYYAGHGAPDAKTESAFLIPYDIDPNYPKTGYSLDKLYESLSGLQAKSVTVFLDACFSGKSRTDEMLVAGARSVIIKTKNSAFSAKNMAVISASSNDEYSAAYPEKYHGIFTYFLLKEIKEKAANLSNINLQKFYENIKTNVVKKAGFLDKEQTPSLIGNDKDRMLILD
ncbi:MAG: caspase family protein [Bacteroidales bacterium]|nr:caspase family protein [Bacteroidales bacterium]MBN2755730.1 caspase family protein [Bacteroidales bacterium]